MSKAEELKKQAAKESEEAKKAQDVANKEAAEAAEAKAKAKAAEAAESFDMEAYETVTFLTLDKKRRKSEKLSDQEQEKLDAAKKIAFANKGRKATRTETYRVAMGIVRLVEGLPTPESIISKFSEHGQSILFTD